jgi:two-component system cell cycle response regulator
MNTASIILIVDDEPFGRDTLAALLGPQGYQLMFAVDGDDALAQAAATPPDVILLDVMMPGMNGFEVCRQLRKHPQLREVPVIMLTALDDREARLEGFEAGADDFVSKPFDRAELRGRVRTITKLNRHRRLLAERSKFEWVVEHADDGYLMTNDAGQLVYANAQARLYLGLSSDEDVQQYQFFDLTQQQYVSEPERSWQAWMEQLAQQSPLAMLLVRPACAKSEKFLLQVEFILMGVSTDEHCLVRLRDITHTIINQNAMWSFQGLIRHKISTSLAQMVGSIRLLDEIGYGAENLKIRELLDIALHGAVHLQEDVHAIFNYIEATDIVGRERDRGSLINLPELLQELSSSRNIPEIQLTTENIADLGQLYPAFSLPGFALVFQELVINSIKFHPNHYPEIDVRLSVDHQQLKISFSDDGTTLTPEQQMQVWQPYYQAERFFTGQVAGMGLGLPMIAAMVWRSGGSCRIFNRQPGPGVTVEITMPLLSTD